MLIKDLLFRGTQEEAQLLAQQMRDDLHVLGGQFISRTKKDHVRTTLKVLEKLFREI